jgi:succinyl-CoA synthetase beta subunit
MRLYEYEGKLLFRKTGIRVPAGRVIDRDSDLSALDSQSWPKVVKAQALKGGRGKAGAILFPNTPEELRNAVDSLLGSVLFGEEVTRALVEEKVDIDREYYLAITYRGDLPALIFSRQGGVEVEEISRTQPSGVIVEPIDISEGLDSRQAHSILARAGVREDAEELADIMLKLYKCFSSNDALLAEINPLARSAEGLFIALDAKVELDDEARFRQKTLDLPERRDFSRKTTGLELLALKNDQMDTRGAAGRMFYEIPGGDILILASGGGTSSEALDSIYLHGGRPAVFTEYSGNPTAEKVKGLTKIALSYPEKIHGVWVVGGRANFTDIYETLVNGILAGIREIPDFDRRTPIVVRRAGLRDMEAFNALRHIRDNEKYTIFLRGMETSIGESARLLIHHANNYQRILRDENPGNARQTG